MKKNDHKTVHKTYINTLGVPHCHIAMGILFIFHWTEHPGIWYHDLWSTTVRIRVTVRLWISTSPLFALFTCCWMSFEAMLGNKEFEFFVSEMTPTVVTRGSASEYSVSVLVSVTSRVHLIPLFKNSLKKSKISSGNSCNYCINNVQTLGLRVYKQKLVNCR